MLCYAKEKWHNIFKVTYLALNTSVITSSNKCDCFLSALMNKNIITYCKKKSLEKVLYISKPVLSRPVQNSWKTTSTKFTWRVFNNFFQLKHLTKIIVYGKIYRCVMSVRQKVHIAKCPTIGSPSGKVSSQKFLQILKNVCFH